MWLEDIRLALEWISVNSTKGNYCCIEKIQNGFIYWTDGTTKSIKAICDEIYREKA